MIRRILIYSGIVLLPFYEVIMLWLFPHKEMSFPDTRVPREILSLNIAFVVGLIGLSKGELTAIPNRPFLILLGLALLAVPIAPPYAFFINGEVLQAFWFYKPLFIITTFLLFISALGGIHFHLDFKEVSRAFVYSGLVMSAYVIFQSFGIDQIFGVLNDSNPDAPYTPMSYSGGTLGHPTIVSPFIAMMVPFCLHDGKYLYAALMALVVMLTKSEIAIAALAAGVVFFYLSHDRLGFKIFCIAILTGCLIFGVLLVSKNPILNRLNASGRIEAWQSILTDNITPLAENMRKTYSFTGKGLGSFSYVFPGEYRSRFHQAHNSILQALHDLGIFGAVLLTLAFISHFKSCYRGLFCVISAWGLELRVLTAAAMILVLGSFGTILLHLGLFWFYFSVIIAMTYGILRQIKAT